MRILSVVAAATMTLTSAGYALPPSSLRCVTPPLQGRIVADGIVPMRKRSVTMIFRSPEAARRAAVGIAPLHDGHAIAVSCRWDDNSDNNVHARRIMESAGIRGTWYLNGNRASFDAAADYRPTARALLRGGNSVGGHSLTHPYFSAINRNRMFREVAAGRIEWEADLDTPVNSYAFSYVDYGRTPDGQVVQADAIRCLLRAGYLHVAEFKGFDETVPSDLAFSPIMPPENADLVTFGTAVQWALGSREVRAKCPMISNSMHAWYGSAALPQYGWDELERRLDLLKAIPDAWHCNQNEYAAYMWLRRLSRLGRPRVSGNVLRMTLAEPTSDVVNHDLSLTLEIAGVGPDDIETARCDGLPVRVSDRSRPDRTLMQLVPMPGDSPPTVIGRVECGEDTRVLASGFEDTDFPGIRAALKYDGKRLRLFLRNGSAHAIGDVRLTWRLPLAFSEGVVRHAVGSVSPGRTAQRVMAPSAGDGDPKLRVGEAYFVAQLDFRWQGEAARLYVTCTHDMGEDRSFPHGAFRVIGPLAANQITPDRLEPIFTRSEALPEAVLLSDGMTHRWRDNCRDGHVPDTHLDCEIIRTSGGWRDTTSRPYLLAAQIRSEIDQSARILCHSEDLRRVFLNGQTVSPSGTLHLRAGLNALVIAYHFDKVTGSHRHAGAFLRLTDPSGNRLTNIQYEPPPEPRLLGVAMLQLEPHRPGDGLDRAFARAETACRDAALKGADIAVMPEMWSIGYQGYVGGDEERRRWQERAIPRDHPWIHRFSALARELGIAIAVTYLERWKGAPRNSLTLFDRRGREVLTYAKMHTCDFANFEAACTPGDRVEVGTLDTRHGPVRVGAMICYDREFPETARLLMLKGAEIVLTPNACELPPERIAQFQTRALENAMAVFMANYAGDFFKGRSVSFDANSAPLAQAGADEQVLTTRIDLDRLRAYRRSTIWGDAFRRPHRYRAIAEPARLPEFERKNAFGDLFDAVRR
jgi:predicted amidohydrolase